MTIFIVRKHKNLGHDGWHHWMKVVSENFTIYSTHATRKEAVAEAGKKNKKAKDYTYTVGKVALK